jgi:S-adenosylmethionine:tRNA ribosyltransferase-isomerase
MSGLLTSDFDYPLPEDLIALHPLPRREDSRMMVLYRDEKRIEHRRFSEFPDFMRKGDLAVLNNTKVIPARVFSDDGRIELLFLQTVAGIEGAENAWKCMVKPGRKMRIDHCVTVAGNTGKVLSILPEGERIIRFEKPVDLDRVGRLPLPPYIDRELEPGDQQRYQTVYAQSPGAVAAPTAGLHFTPEILGKIPHTFITLHVGVGTFKPVQTECITDHPMHAEQFVIEKAAADAINAAKRIIAIGTTTTRVLESAMQREGKISAMEGGTDIFIYPPYEFAAIDALLTNFHLPKSTLLTLVSALAGREFILKAYAEAIRERYRFFSYGDCMLIL